MKKVALLVGVSEYQPGLQPLPSAIEDARAMERVLQNPEMGGFDKVDVLANADLQTMRIAIYHLFAERNPEDLVLFYFSGHGVKDQNLNLYLTTPETTKSQRGLIVPPTAVAASYLQTQINNSRSEHEVIILDCCYSGAIAKGLTAKDEGQIDIIAELGGKGRAILTSSTSVQSSFQQEGTLSIYTQYLVEGIETGAADINNDGRISVDELHQYTSNKVRQASPAMTPQFYPVQEGFKIYLARSQKDDPKLKYRKAVQEIAQENQGNIDPILDRPYLDELSRSLEISAEEAKNIETEVLEPFLQRQRKLMRYEEVLLETLKNNGVITDKARLKLERLQKVLELRDKDIEEIEKPILDAKEAEPKEEVSKSVSQLVVIPSLQDFPFQAITVNDKGQEIKRESGQAQYFKEDLGNDVSLDMVKIPGGSFMMGTEDEEIERLVKKFNWDAFRKEKPQHQVIVKPFYMGKYLVTQKQWKAIASLPKVNHDLNLDPSRFKGDDLPVEKVSWHDAVEFCQRLSLHTGKEYRLPSEAEWEYTCRSGTTTPFYFGETITGELANYHANNIYANEPKGEYRGKTTPVGSFPPNAFGLCDMHGNVWEWCEDDWHNSYEGAPTDGRAWISENSNTKVMRGGSWASDPDLCRSAFRLIDIPVNRVNYDGFRVACGVPGTL